MLLLKVWTPYSMLAFASEPIPLMIPLFELLMKAMIVSLSSD
jgi:hypothetical protein